VARRDVADVVNPELVAPVDGEPGEGAGELAYVLLRVRATVRAEREQLHQLTRVVLVRAPACVLVEVEPDDHRRVLRHVVRELVEGVEGVAAEELVLVEHQTLLSDGVVRGGEPVVPDERHSLDQRLVGADHAIEEPEVVVAVEVSGGDRVPVLVGRLGTRERRRTRGTGQGGHSRVKAHRRERLRVTRRRAEARAPEQPLRLADAELAGVDGDRALELELRGRRGRRRRDRLNRDEPARAPTLLPLLPYTGPCPAAAALRSALHLRIPELGSRARPRTPLARCTARLGLATALTAPRRGVAPWVHLVPIGGHGLRP